MATKALFLDRDGIVNVDKNYLYRIEDFVFVDGIFQLCHFFAAQGFLLFIVTNQAGIAKGLYTEKEFNELTIWVEQQFLNNDLKIQKTYFCPHHPNAKIAQYKQNCQCRKPAPLMILSAAKEFNIDLSQSILIGDKSSDIQAGQQAGIKQNYLIQSPYQQEFDFVSVNQLYQHLSSKHRG